MINVHFNGDIIRCPDIAAIQQRLIEQRKKLSICQFGIQECNCKAWTDYQMLRPKERINRHCTLCRQYELTKDDISLEAKKVYKCQKAQERYNNALKQKHFVIDNNNYRKISSAAHYLLKTSKYRTLFLLLTFPPWKEGFNPYKNENKLNECFSKFAENLVATYNCSGYIAVRELGKDTRRYHYHILCSIPFVPFPILNAAWCAAISDICEASPNALSSEPDNRLVEIKTPGRAVRYICKYISKSKQQSSKSRLIFIANSLFRKPVSIRGEENKLYDKTGIMFLDSYLLSLKSVTISKINDYCTAIRVNNNEDFDKICNEVIYPMFNLPDNLKVDLYSYPDIKPPGAN